jgi:hypothetical protein
MVVYGGPIIAIIGVCTWDELEYTSPTIAQFTGDIWSRYISCCVMAGDEDRLAGDVARQRFAAETGRYAIIDKPATLSTRLAAGRARQTGGQRGTYPVATD